MFYGDEDQNDIMYEIDHNHRDPLEEELTKEELTEEQKTRIAECEKQIAETLKKLDNEELPY